MWVIKSEKILKFYFSGKIVILLEENGKIAVNAGNEAHKSKPSSLEIPSWDGAVLEYLKVNCSKHSNIWKSPWILVIGSSWKEKSYYW